jgi:N6-L-threonylcarbamoyladenine synthase
MRDRLAPRGADGYATSPRLASDNAAMIARAGVFHAERGNSSPLELDAFASAPLPGLLDS